MGQSRSLDLWPEGGSRDLEEVGGGGFVNPFGEENDSHFFPHLEMNHCSMIQAETLEPSD